AKGRRGAQAAEGGPHVPGSSAGKRKVKFPEAAQNRRRRQPALVRVEAVRADAEHIAFPLLELADAAAEGGHLRWTDERKIARIKDQDQPAIEEIVLRYVPARIRRPARAL